MFAKLSLGRYSQPKRLSIVHEPDDENNGRFGDGRKSSIPRLTSIRSSSADREVVDNRRLTQNSKTSSQGELCDSVLKRSRSAENLCTPKYSAKKGIVCSSRNTESRSARKDTRPLTDKVYVAGELAKVRQYLVSARILGKQAVQDVKCPMSSNLFISIMDALLKKFFPSQTVTSSNYCELIPVLMRKLKYPGNITRSWLVTANAPHSWPHVVGLFAWLTNLLSLHMNEFKFVDDEPVMNGDEISKVYYTIRKEYISWTETDRFSCDGGEVYAGFFSAKKEALNVGLSNVLERVAELEHQLECYQPGEDKFKAAKEKYEKTKLTVFSLKTKIQSLQSRLSNCLKEKDILIRKNKSLLSQVSDVDSTKQRSTNDLQEVELQINSLRNTLKLQEEHISDISNQCYTADIKIARLQGKITKVKLDRDALLRECTSEHTQVFKSTPSFTYGSSDNDPAVSKFFDDVKEVKMKIGNIHKNNIEKEKDLTLQITEEQMKLKKIQRDIENIELAVHHLEEKLTLLNSKVSELEVKVKAQEESNLEAKKKHVFQKIVLDAKEKKLLDVEKELKTLVDYYSETDEQYKGILIQMKEMMLAYRQETREHMRNSFNFDS